jgi:hypothetical protein
MLTPSLLQEFSREIEHWETAAERLSDVDTMAPPQAWQSLEHYLGVSLRQSLAVVLGRLLSKIRTAKHQLAAGERSAAALQGSLVDIRQAYLRVETTIDFYADALLTRSIPRLSAFLRACDHIATRSMAEALAPMGRQVPAALTYIDKGLGASIIKIGLRLWDGTIENPVATIKVTRHHLLRPCQVLHEAGHQVAFTLGWNAELADALRTGLPSDLGSIWAGWASEIAADAFAHTHAGFGAAAALLDVVDGSDRTVFALLPGDPHPIAFLRVLCALEMSRQSFGRGPWDRAAESWLAKHPVERSPSDIRDFVNASMTGMSRIVEIILSRPYRAFGGGPLTRLIDPGRVSPAALAGLERDAGRAAFTSPYWAWNESIRLLALTAFRAALGPRDLRTAVADQEAWMTKLGALSSAA